MPKSTRKTYPGYIFIDLCFMAIAFFTPYILNAIRKYSLKEVLEGTCFPKFTEYCFIFILWSIYIIIDFNRKRLYSTSRDMTILRELSKVFKSVLYASIIIATILFFAQYKFFSRFTFGGSFILLFALLGGWRTAKKMILRKLIKDGFRNKSVLIIGTEEVGKLILEEIKKHPYLGLNVIGFLSEHDEGFVNGVPILGKFPKFAQIAQKHFVDEVIFAIPSSDKAVPKLIKETQQLRLGTRVVSECIDELFPQRIAYIGIVPLLTFHESTPHSSETSIKRLFDITVSFFLLVLLSPLFIIFAILIKCDSLGPVFFTQKRWGRKGSVIKLYKFRTMNNNADKQQTDLLEQNEVKDGVVFKMKKDPRVTKIGQLLRRYSLDELPQLFNVFKNDMSMVGPRPLPLDQIEQDDLRQFKRLEIKPGITGLPQVRGRSDLSFYKWVRWDLWYINNWSVMLDVKILFWTIPAVLKGKGAY